MYKFLDFFRDKQNRIVIFQFPNLPLILWFVFAVLDYLWSSNQPGVHHLLGMLRFGFIFTWAWLEITSGVNYFRRTLGVLVLIIVVASSL
ncbi:hypothetical protein [Legionella genomosp. 1]|uniref:hypothetical protein n=1 Tax=Legionella genomosp. 1 TaxID=1093625 RepID=UPI0010564EF2|nr:hypothetical protein [Legionella genomosp. 1]